MVLVFFITSFSVKYELLIIEVNFKWRFSQMTADYLTVRPPLNFINLARDYFIHAHRSYLELPSLFKTIFVRMNKSLK